MKDSGRMNTTCRKPKCRRNGESGQTLVEHAGMAIVVAAIIVAIIAVGLGTAGTDLGKQIVCKIGSAISQIGGDAPLDCSVADSAGGGNSAGQRDPKAPTTCKVSSTTDSSSSYVKIGIVKIGESFAFVTQEEQYIDDETGEIKTRYSVVATDGGSLGATGGVGAKGNLGALKVGADLSGEAGFNVKVGDTWEFDSKEDMDAFTQKYSDWRIQQEQLSHDESGGYALYLWVTDGYLDPPRSPDKTSVSGEFNAEGSGTLGPRFGNDDKSSEEGNEGDSKPVKLNLGAYVKSSVGQSVARQTDHRKGREGEYTDTVTYSGSLGGGGDLLFAGVSGTGSYEGAMATTYGADGKLKQLAFTQTTSGDLTWNVASPVKGSVGGKGTTSDKGTHVTTTSVEVTDENRAAIESWLSQAYVNDPQSGTATLQLPPNVLNPNVPVPGDPMQQVLYNDATSTDSTYDVSGEGFSASLDVALGLKVGAGMAYNNEDSEIRSQTYLGEYPSEGAERPRKESEVCRH